jgi:hypothetical protein
VRESSDPASRLTRDMAIALDPERSHVYILPSTLPPLLSHLSLHIGCNEQTPIMATEPGKAIEPVKAVKETEPFRFLDLPAELRCAVYELLDAETRLHTIIDPYVYRPLGIDKKPSTSKAAIVVKDVPTAILATCRMVYAEAAPILIPKLKKVRQNEPIHFIVDSCNFNTFLPRGSGLRLVFVNRMRKADIKLAATDVTYRKTFTFIHKCRLYMKSIKSGKMVVTVKSHAEAAKSDFALTELFDDMFWKTNFGVTKLDMHLFNFDEDKVEPVDNWCAYYEQEGMAHPTYRVIEEAEWNEIWTDEEINGF